MPAAKVGSLLIDVAANVAGIKKDFDQIQANVNQFSRQVNSAFKSLGITIGAGFGIAGLTTQVKSWINAAAEAETETNKLAASLRAHGLTSRSSVTAYTNIASSISGMTGQSKEAVMHMERLLTALGVTPKQIEPATRAAISLASTFDLDLNTAAEGVGRALEGNYKALGKYVQGLMGAKVGTVEASEVLELIEEAVGNAGQNINTFAKQTKQLENSWRELNIELGQIFLPIAKDIIEAMGGITHALLEGTQANQTSWLRKELKIIDDTITTLQHTVETEGEGFWESLFGAKEVKAGAQTEINALLIKRSEIIKQIADNEAELNRILAEEEPRFKKSLSQYDLEAKKKEIDELSKLEKELLDWTAKHTYALEEALVAGEELQKVYDVQAAKDAARFIEKWESDIDHARSKLKGLGDTGTSEFKRLEDAITMVGSKFSDTVADMVTGTEVSFKDMIDSMIHDLVRFQIQAQMTQFVPQITRGIGGMVGGWFGGGTAGIPTYSPERQPGALTMGGAYTGNAAGAASATAATSAAAGAAASVDPIITAALIAFAIADSQSGGKISTIGGNLLENKYLAAIFPFFNPVQTYKSWKELITKPKQFFGQGEDEASKVAFGFNLPDSAMTWERMGPLGTIGLTKEKGVSGSDLESALRSWVKFDEEVAQLLSEEQIAKIKTMAGWSTATYHDFQGKDFDNAMIDRFRRIGRELGEDFIGELMAAFKGGTAELAAYLDKMELIDKIRDWFGMTGMKDVFIDWEDFTDDGLAALDKLISEWTTRMESATASAAGSFQAGMQEALKADTSWESFEMAVRKHILDSVTSGLIAGFAQTSIVQKALAPFFATMDEAFSQAFAGGTFNKDVWDALMGPAAANLDASMAAMTPVFYALADLIRRLNESLAGIPSYQGGTDYVPRTGLYRLHQGEAVLSSESSRRGHITVGSLVTVHGSLIADRGEFDRFILRVKSALDEVQRTQRPGRIYAERRAIDAGVN